MIYAKEDEIINRDNINQILNYFAKEYRKNCGSTPIEILIVGGGSIIINYGFRYASRDIDAQINTKPSGLRETIISVSDKLNLPDDWLNTDFMTLSSNSDKLSEVSVFYRSLNNNTINIRTIKGKYLIAMKMQSGREYGNDIPDIIGILKEEKEIGHNITFEEIMESGRYLYSKFQVSDSLLKRVEKFCQMSIEELDAEYNKSVFLTEQILENVLLKKDNKEFNKASAKELAQLIQSDLDSKEENLIDEIK